MNGNQIREFLQDDDGQDLIEFSLLLAFVVLVGAASYIGIAGSVDFIWTIVNSRMGEANQVIN